MHGGGYLQVCTVAKSRAAWVVFAACMVSVGQLVPVAMVLCVVVGGIVGGLGIWVAIVALGRWGIVGVCVLVVVSWVVLVVEMEAEAHGQGRAVLGLEARRALVSSQLRHGSPEMIPLLRPCPRPRSAEQAGLCLH